jgi:Flp pilus assembly protein TadD
VTRAWVLSAIAAVALAAFFPVLSNGFVDFDDGLYVFDNEWVRGGLSWEGFRWAFSLPRNGETYWHPLTWLSLMLDVQCFGVSAGAIHAVNLLLHVAAAAFLYLALDELTARPRASAAAALVWVVHPLHVEAVAWAVERKTVLAGMLAFAALWVYARYAARPSARRLLLVGALLALGMLAKPMVVTLPFLFLLIDVWPAGRTRLAAPARPGAAHEPLPWKRLLVEKAPLFAVVALGLAVAAVTHPVPRVEEVPFALRVANAITGYWAYVAKAVWPSRLAVFYPQVATIALWKVLLALAGMLGAIWFSVWPRLRLPATIGILWFLGCMFPMSGLMRGGLWPGMADRFMYLPLAGLVVALVWSAVAAGSPRARRVLTAGAVLLVAALGARTHAYALRWRDSESLFRQTVESTDRATLMRVNLGKALEAKGRVDEAREVYEELVAVAPGSPDGYVNLGVLAHARGDLAGAEALYAEALRVAPRSGEALYDLGLLRKRAGRTAEALQLFERARQSGFGKAEVYSQLGSLYWSGGRLDEAEATFRQGLEREPRGWRLAFNLASLLAARGRSGEAIQLLKGARERALLLRQDPAPIDDLLRKIAAGAR